MDPLPVPRPHDDRPTDRGGLTLLTVITDTHEAIATAGHHVDRAMQIVADQACALTGAAGVLVELAEGEELVCRAVSGIATPHLGSRIRTGASAPARSVRTGEVFRCDDSERGEHAEQEACRRVGARSLIAAPLPGHERVFGALTIYSAEPEAFDEEDAAVVRLLGRLLAGSIGEARRLAAMEVLLQENERATSALAESEGRFRAIFDGAPIGVALVGLDGCAVEVNEVLERQLGCTADELEGVRFTDFGRLDDGGGDEELFEELVTGRRTHYHCERRYRRKDGSVLWGNLSVALLSEPSGRPRFAVAMIEDITERRQAEQLLAAQRTELERSNRELQDFAYIASHDLQEPLRKIQAFADIVATEHRQTIGAEGEDFLGRIQSSATRMRRLIDDLLAYSRVGTQGQPPEPVDCSTVVQEVISDLQIRLEETGGEVRVGELPTVLADPVQIRQLFQNLIVNALKFHRDGVPPVVEIGSELRSPDEGPLIRVRDNGIGIPEEFAEKVFTPFERLHSRREYEGTGIGLAISRKIVERHGGSIHVRSVVGEGSELVVRLPAHVSI